MPRCIVTGFTSDGKSCVVSKETFELPLRGTDAQEMGVALRGAGPEDRVQHVLFSSASLAVPVRGAGEHLDLGVPPGGLRWIITYSPPGRRTLTAMHYTDTFDLVAVIGGSVDLILEDGEHSLQAGDFVVQTGGNHAWRAGPEGCTKLISLSGTEPNG